MRTSTKARSSPATAAAYLERVNLAIDRIVSGLHKPGGVRLKELSRIAMLSPYHFHRVFQGVVGETPADFAKRLRLERALGMLAVEGKKPPMATVARRCGFASVSDLSRSFKQRYGSAPSRFDFAAWRRERAGELDATVEQSGQPIARLPSRSNPDRFDARIRDLPARTVAYIRVDQPYAGGVIEAAQRLMAWAERHGFAGNQWLGYQWDNPEVTPLKDCKYHVAVEADDFEPLGEVGRFRFPAMTVAQVEMQGGIDMELRALRWMYGSWLPWSGYVPDDHPGFEAWVGRPFALGMEEFALKLQLPVRRAR